MPPHETSFSDRRHVRVCRAGKDAQQFHQDSSRLTLCARVSTGGVVQRKSTGGMVLDALARLAEQCTDVPRFGN